MEPFTPPLYFTLVMFVGMALALPWHFWESRGSEEPGPSLGLIALLCVPALLDMIGTAILMLGLLLIPLSVNNLLRGSIIIFVAGAKQFVLGDQLTKPMWAGVGVITIAITVIGVAAVGNGGGGAGSGDASGLLAGVALTIVATLVSAVQFVAEEKLMSSLSAPPMLLVGMEGLCGTVLTLFVAYPIYYYIPGADHGHFEDPWNTIAKLGNSTPAVLLSLAAMLSTFLFNVFSMLVTHKLSSVWKAILQNIRPASIWLTQLALYYYVTDGAFGEAWLGLASWVQLAGMLMLLLGMAVYNGNITLPGCADDTVMSPMTDDAKVRASTADADTRPIISRASVRQSGLSKSLLPK